MGSKVKDGEIVFDDDHITPNGEIVFDDDHITPTKPIKPGDTSQVPLSGAQGGQITSPGFIPALPPGKDVALLKDGDRIVMVQGGNRWEDVAGNLETTIHGHEKYKVNSGREIKIEGGDIRQVKGDDLISIDGNRVIAVTGNKSESILGSLLRSVLGGELVNEVSKWFKMTPLDVKLCLLEMKLCGVSRNTYGANVSSSLVKGDINATKTDFSLMTVGLEMAKTELGAAGITIKAAKIISGGASNKMDMLGS